MEIPKLEKVKARQITYKVGDKKNGYEVLPLNERKKVLLLSDDFRMFSGVATVSRELVLGTCHRFNYVQLGAAVQHPELGKITDVSEDIAKRSEISNASVKIYASNGYGNPQVLRQLISLEDPDLIVHFTDPRQWEWLYEMEHEVRQIIPLTYLNIWDSLPDPQYNETFYASCDLLMSISKQTYGINKRVLERFGNKVLDVSKVTKKKKVDNIISYVPHGINKELYKKVDSDDKKFQEYKKNLQSNYKDEKKFIILWANRNMGRKNPADVIFAYKMFCEMIGKEKAKECLLLMHTAIVDNNGTDLRRVTDDLCQEYDVLFHEQNVPPEEMKYLYNIADVTVNISSNEGFGLTSAESLMCEVPIIVNVTGGLQDQCGFKDDNGKLLTYKDYIGEWGSNHDGKYKKHGNWVIPVYPTNRSIKGSPPTPYISDDRCDYQDVALALKKMYEKGNDKREKMGKEGRKFMLSKESNLESGNMCKLYIQSLETTLSVFEPKKRFSLDKISDSEVVREPVDVLTYNKHKKLLEV